MKRIINFLLAVTLMFSVCVFGGCDDVSSDLVLNVYNWEDYISQGDVDIVKNFEEYYYEKYDKTVTVNYSTFGTNENMYNELQLTKVKKENEYTYTYDLVCPSDYMIQKMIVEDMLEKYDYSIEEGNVGCLSNYTNYGSNYIKNLFDNYGWTDYATCYMWGTMGFVYNPEVLSNSSLYCEGDENHWSLPWKTYSKNLGTIKDSIRDTYALAVGYVYSDELLSLKDKFTDGQLSDKEYNEKIVEIFNRVDKETVNKVEKSLKDLKGNVYGFEVDSGKKDMATGKIAINFAWSGDAVYTLDLAEEDGAELYYAVPEEGSNIWFDGWVMPKGANVPLAQEFINYLAAPENAIANMNYIGYTSAIGGDDMFDNCIDWYGTYVLVEQDEETEDSVLLDGKYYEEIYVGDMTVAELASFKNNEDGTYDFIYPEYDDEDNVIGMYEETGVTLYETDLSYIFNTGTENNEYIIFTDVIGRQCSTQYPDYETVTRCAIMKYFNDEEMSLLHNMWDEVKVSAIPLWLMISIIVVILVCIIFVIVVNHLSKKGIAFERKTNHNNLVPVKREIIK